MRVQLDALACSLEEAEKAIATLDGATDEVQRYRANFICEEILTNLARHADFAEKIPEVTLEIEAGGNGLCLHFRDNAAPFNLLEFPDPDMESALEETEAGGLGIFLTRQYARSIDYRYEAGCNLLDVCL